jgi:serine phosphatase RsbU (regulator of sigma subunit)
MPSAAEALSRFLRDLDAKSREFRYSAAGHPLLLLARNEVVHGELKRMA